MEKVNDGRLKLIADGWVKLGVISSEFGAISYRSLTRKTYMKRTIYHIIIPAIMPVLFFVVASTPVEVLGCLVRGLIVLLIALMSGLAALGAAVIGVKGGAKGRVRHDKNAIWWVTSTLILVIPVIAMIVMA